MSEIADMQSFRGWAERFRKDIIEDPSVIRKPILLASTIRMSTDLADIGKEKIIVSNIPWVNLPSELQRVVENSRPRRSINDRGTVYAPYEGLSTDIILGSEVVELEFTTPTGAEHTFIWPKRLSFSFSHANSQEGSKWQSPLGLMDEDLYHATVFQMHAIAAVFVKERKQGNVVVRSFI